MDGNAFARSNAYTKTIYRDVYPAVDPSSPALSQRGKVVIVTGAGSGIGAQGIVPAFAMAGATGIVLVGRSRAKLQETAAAVHKQFPAVELLEVAADISEEKDVDMLFASAIAKFGHVDVLVNNASVLFELTHVEASDPIDWWTHFKINTLGTYLMNRMFLRVVGPEKQGAIVNMTSGASRVAIPGFSAYGLSKAAVNKLSEYPEVERPNINCVTLDPGAVRTDMVPSKCPTIAGSKNSIMGPRTSCYSII